MSLPVDENVANSVTMGDNPLAPPSPPHPHHYRHRHHYRKYITTILLHVLKQNPLRLLCLKINVF